MTAFNVALADCRVAFEQFGFGVGFGGAAEHIAEPMFALYEARQSLTEHASRQTSSTSRRAMRFDGRLG